MRPLQEADPRVLGRYRMFAELGRGGMGRVLLGSGPDGRLVAVKLVHPQLLVDEGFRARFRREVDASRMVSGAYTAPVVDADPDAEIPWLASVFVPGPGLHTAVQEAGTLPGPALLRLAAGLAAALGSVHRAGLVHRDLKPSNVLLADDGPRVIDFGIARAVDAEDAGADGGLTRTGWLVGSPCYMSPEQAEGEPIGPASDVFSLGTVLAMAATGHCPFDATSAQRVMYRIVHHEPDLAAIPEPVRGIVQWCLAKDPAARPTPDQLLDAIGPIAPAPRPWPAAVHQMVARQQAEVARYFDGPWAASEETLVQPTPTRVEPPPGTTVDRPAPPRRRRTGLIAGAAAAVIAVALAVTAVVLATSGGDHPKHGAGSSHKVQAHGGASSPSDSPSPSQPPANGIDPGAWYQVVNTNSKECLDAVQAGTNDGTLVQQWPCGVQTNQGWQFTPTGDGYYKIANRNAPTLFLDVLGGPTATGNGTHIDIWSDTSTPNQRWKPVPLGGGVFQFSAQHSGSCLDVTNGAADDGTLLQQWPCTPNDAAQTFTLVQEG